MANRFVEITEDDAENDIIAPTDKIEVVNFQTTSTDKLHEANIPQVPLYERHTLEFIVILIGATALSFNAGFVNGCTYQFRNIPVSHVTGTTTHAGLNLGSEDWDSFAVNMAIVVSFVFGAFITGFCMPTDSFELGAEYGPLFLIGSVLFAVACITSYEWPNSNFYFYFAAMACGLQNAMTTRYSGSIIRTTHVTGTATDIGLVLGRVCYGEKKELWKLKVLLPLYISFLLGGTVSVPVFKRLGKHSLLVNVTVFFSIGLVYSIIVGQHMHIPFWKAFFGTYVRIERRVKHRSAQIKAVAAKMSSTRSMR